MTLDTYYLSVLPNLEWKIIMQITKRQHYVPRFYMKPFSTINNKETKKEKVSISFFNISKDTVKDNVPIKSICAENFFYGKDGVTEKKLAEKEKNWAKLISKINQGEKLTENEVYYIREFMIYQISRTKAILDHNRKMFTVISTAIMSNQSPEIDKDAIKDAVGKKVENEITSEYNLSFVTETLPAVTDLKFCVLENKTNSFFITSDAPVIVVNPLGYYGAGLANIGTVVFFPISPQKLVMFYDGKLYEKIMGEICDTACIDAFNKYQYLNADEMILARKSAEFMKYTQDEELRTFRKRFHIESKTSTSSDNNRGTFIAVKSRTVEYCIDIPLLKLPKVLRKIPRDFRDTFPRKYSVKTRWAILCRIYGEAKFNQNYWKKAQKYARIMLPYLDYYWNTPNEDCALSGDDMRRLKATSVQFIPKEGAISNEFLSSDRME